MISLDCAEIASFWHLGNNFGITRLRLGLADHVARIRPTRVVPRGRTANWRANGLWDDSYLHWYFRDLDPPVRRSVPAEMERGATAWRVKCGSRKTSRVGSTIRSDSWIKLGVHSGHTQRQSSGGCRFPRQSSAGGPTGDCFAGEIEGEVRNPSVERSDCFSADAAWNIFGAAAFLAASPRPESSPLPLCTRVHR
jgi:hypothetical protein